MNCARCGGILKASSEKVRFPKQAETGITGAAKMDYHMHIHPCDACFEAAMKPVRALKNALDSLERLEG